MNKLKYIAIIIITALLGCEDDTKTLTNPKADFEFEIHQGEVQFINLSTGSDVFAWEFGDIDNGYSEEKNPLYTYLRDGSYDVDVTLHAGNGLTGENDEIVKTVSLKNVPPSIIIDGDFSDWKNVPYTKAAGSGSLQKIKWVSTKYNFSVLLEGTSAMGMQMLDLKIDVDNNDETGLVNGQFINGGMDIRGVGADIYHWIDPSESVNNQPFKYIVEPGVWFYKSAVKTMENGNKAVEITYPKDRLAELAKVPLSSDGVKISFIDFTKSWNALGEIPTRNEGNEMIFVAFNTDYSVVDFDYAIDKGTVTFTNYSQNVTSYTWDFGDGSEPVQENAPVHTYEENGDYEVTLTANNVETGEEVSKTLTVSITDIIPILPVSVDFSYVVDGGNVDFTNTSENADQYSWDFGDGSALSTEVSPSHTYTQSGTYTVTLEATNSASGETKSAQQSVAVTVIAPSIAIDGDFSDWDEVAYAANLTGAGSLQKLKYKVEGNKINMLFVGTDAMKLGMIQTRFDIDNNSSTGWNPTGQYGSSCGIELRGVGKELYDRRNGASKLLTSTTPWFERSEGIGTLTTGEYAVEIAYDIATMEGLLGTSFASEGIGFGLLDHPAWNNWDILGSLPAISQGNDLLFISFE